MSELCNVSFCVTGPSQGDLHVVIDHPDAFPSAFSSDQKLIANNDDGALAALAMLFLYDLAASAHRAKSEPDPFLERVLDEICSHADGVDVHRSETGRYPFFGEIRGLLIALSSRWIHTCTTTDVEVGEYDLGTIFHLGFAAPELVEVLGDRAETGTTLDMAALSWYASSSVPESKPLDTSNLARLPELYDDVHCLEPFKEGDRQSITPEKALFSHDGAHLILVSQAGEVAVFDTEHFNEQWRASVPLYEGNKVQLAPENGRLFVPLDKDAKEPVVWVIATGEEEAAPYFSPRSPISPDGRWTADLERGLVVDSALTWKIETPYEASELSISEDERWLVISSDRHYIALWDLTTQTCVARYPFEEGCPKLSHDGRIFAFEHKKELVFRDAHSGACLKQRELGVYIEVAWSPCGRWFALCETSDVLRLHLYRCGTDGLPMLDDPVASRLMENGDGEPFTVLFSHDSDAFLVSFWDGKIFSYSIPKLEMLWCDVPDEARPATVVGLKREPGTSLVSEQVNVLRDGVEEMWSWDTQTGARSRLPATPSTLSSKGTYGFEFSGASNNYVEVSQHQTFKFSDRIESFAFGVKPNELLIAGQFGDVIVWDLKNRCEQRRFEALAKRVTQLSVSPDGVYFGQVSDFHEVVIRRLSDGAVASRFRSQDYVYAPVWSPDGRWVVLQHIGGNGWGGSFTVHCVGKDAR